VSDRVDRLFQKAEAAIDRGDTYQAEAYMELLRPAIYFGLREAKDLAKTFGASEYRGRHVR
jgi:hypothetical protein